MNVTGRGCRLTHGGARDFDIYETLPREIRDALKIASGNWCCGCIRNELRRYQKRYGPKTAIAMMLQSMEVARRTETEGRGRDTVYYLREELKP